MTAACWSDGAAGPVLSLFDELTDPGTWMDRALCAEVDPELFFPEKGGSTREAKRVCALCDVRAECLAYALDMESRPGTVSYHGIWGGTTGRDRRRLQRERGQELAA